MFQTVPLSIIRSLRCTHSNGICHTGWVVYMKPPRMWNSTDGLILQTFPSVNILFFWALMPCHTHCGACQAKQPTSYLIWFQSWPFSWPSNHIQRGDFCHLTVRRGVGNIGTAQGPMKLVTSLLSFCCANCISPISFLCCLWCLSFPYRWLVVVSPSLQF